jgi:hypothetical protein
VAATLTSGRSGDERDFAFDTIARCHVVPPAVRSAAGPSAVKLAIGQRSGDPTVPGAATIRALVAVGASVTVTSLGEP